MKILLIDADSKILNIALGKLSTYWKNQNADVELLKLNISYYPNRKNENHFIPTNLYDKVFCSIIYPNSLKYIYGNNITFGGTGYDLTTKLPPNIENLPVDYSIYPNNDTSYGFITRGCIRNCEFCVVPQKEGYIHQVNTINNIVQHKKVKFLDINILSFPDHKLILQELIDKNIKCCFNQGLDIRLITPENSVLLNQLNYLGNYVFAFDSVKYLKMIRNKLKLLNWRRPFNFKFFVYIHPDMPISSIRIRLEWLKENQCLPYAMRDITCWSSFLNKFYIDIAAWANQPGIFKIMSFKEFVFARHKNNLARAEKSFGLYIGKKDQNITLF
jgi:hypothetical protein